MIAGTMWLSCRANSAVRLSRENGREISPDTWASDLASNLKGKLANSHGYARLSTGRGSLHVFAAYDVVSILGYGTSAYLGRTTESPLPSLIIGTEEAFDDILGPAPTLVDIVLTSPPWPVAGLYAEDLRKGMFFRCAYDLAAERVFDEICRASSRQGVTGDDITPPKAPCVRDGGLDRLRLTSDGKLLGVNVRGGTTMSFTGFKGGPSHEASKFFSVDGRQHRPAAAKARANRFGLTPDQDRSLELLMMLVGRRAPAGHWHVKGKGIDGSPRHLIAAATDLIQVGRSRQYIDRVRVDTSAAVLHRPLRTDAARHISPSLQALTSELWKRLDTERYDTPSGRSRSNAIGRLATPSGQLSLPSS